MTRARVAGLLLAAGSGRRYGRPKALVDTGSGPWVLTSLSALQDCDVRLVVLGASGDEVAALLPDDVHVVHNPDHGSGMGSSLRQGLTVLSAAAALSTPAMGPSGEPSRADAPITSCDAVVVHLVDLPGVGARVVRRLIGATGSTSAASAALLRATYLGAPGHPVLLGRDHWAGAMEAASGDTGAREYFRVHPPAAVECGDIGTGDDVDVPPAR